MKPEGNCILRRHLGARAENRGGKEGAHGVLDGRLAPALLQAARPRKRLTANWSAARNEPRATKLLAFF